MEEQLRDLVLTNGFESVFTTLKVLVMCEYERAKRDYDFLQSLVKPSVTVGQSPTLSDPILGSVTQEQESVLQPEADDEVVELPDTKRISIKDGAKMRLPTRKVPKTATT